jgi:hypothetical protein
MQWRMREEAGMLIIYSRLNTIRSQGPPIRHFHLARVANNPGKKENELAAQCRAIAQTRKTHYISLMKQIDWISPLRVFHDLMLPARPLACPLLRFAR